MYRHVVVLLLLFAAAPAFALQTPTVNPQPDLSLLWTQVQRQPDDFTVSCIPLNSPANAVYYRPDAAQPVASVGKLLIFIEYTWQVFNGVLSNDEMISIDELNWYDLERTDGGAHQRFLATYPNTTQAISLWDIASRGMMQYSSNAASDYILLRLGQVDWTRWTRTLRLTNTTPPHSLTLIPIMMGNHETGELTDADVVSAALFDSAQTFLTRFITDAQWHEAELLYRQLPRRGFPSWEVQGRILNLYTMSGTTRDFTNVLAAIYAESSPLPERMRQLLRAGLRWTENAAINNTYFEYGSKLGFYSGGTLALVAYGYPFEGQPVISAMFFRNIPRDIYRDMLNQDSIGDLAHWVNLNGCNGLASRLPRA